MPTRRTRSKRHPPDAWKTVLYFVNGGPSPDTWKEFLLAAPPAPIKLAPGVAIPDGPLEGLRSFDELEAILREFRDYLSRLVRFPTVRAAEASEVRATLNQRAQGEFKGWQWARGTGRLFARIEPADLSREQSLYAQLATAMTVESFTVIKQCGRRECGRFFYEPKRRKVRYCSAACGEADAKARTLRYREEHQDEYREYQRRLMAKRRREGKA